MTSLEESICQAIDIITASRISTSSCDKTIQATIISCIDLEKGLYKLKFQDATFEAYSTNVNIEYKEGSQVYVLVENGDLSKKKIINGAVDNFGSITRSGEWIYL